MIDKGVLYKIYDRWALENHLTVLGAEAFSRRLTERGIKCGPKGKARKRHYIGIGLLDPGTTNQE